ncbi:hypothetical protein [Streptomyces sp. TRM49041]|uniref:hypothetical protein n=1 Tax=Streptomyces sp. TRM49041 TaxID=2603216 RepID=UPI0011EBA8E2|nr:hypothetical protein [Streptomyces sp. TRM49041]
MSMCTGTRLVTVCVGIAGAGMAAAVPAAAEAPPASVGAPVVSNLSTGLLGSPAQGKGDGPGQPAGLPVGGGLLGGLPTAGLPLGD